MQTAYSWGFLGHRTINRQAVYALPPDMFGFYKKHMEWLSTHSVDADNRRYLVADEGCRHFLDCDRYEKAAPLDTIPHNWFKAVEQYTEDSLKAHGIVPWHCISMLYWLKKAFEEKNLQKILRHSADIGHYIADAHVPLHTTHNYNGQFTGQEGIHALWESRIPQLFSDSFDLLTGTASYLTDPQSAIWDATGESFGYVDSVLRLEKETEKRHAADKYSFETRGTVTARVYSAAFCTDYHQSMQHMVEKRMRSAIRMVASFWLTAWVMAGQPDLNSITETTQTADPMDEKAEKARQTQPIKGREEHGNE
ncbi:MAG: S1/P1 Nuclease [Bacteroidetes bacterium]|nr:S1/P1 Nuclease [Bacteroidota bacterium]